MSQICDKVDTPLTPGRSILVPLFFKELRKPCGNQQWVQTRGNRCSPRCESELESNTSHLKHTLEMQISTQRHAGRAPSISASAPRDPTPRQRYRNQSHSYIHRFGRSWRSVWNLHMLVDSCHTSSRQRIGRRERSCLTVDLEGQPQRI